MKRKATARKALKKFKTSKAFGETHWRNAEMTPGVTDYAYYYKISDIGSGGETVKRLGSKVYYTNLSFHAWLAYDYQFANNLAPVRVMVVISKMGELAGAGGISDAPSYKGTANHHKYKVLMDRYYAINRDNVNTIQTPTVINKTITINQATRFTSDSSSTDFSSQNPIYIWFISDSGAGFTLKSRAQLYWKDY